MSGILALDIASVSGWSHGPIIRAPGSAAMPDSGSVRFGEPGCEVGRFLHLLEEWIEAAVERMDPEIVIFESPILPDTRHTRLETLWKLYGATGELLKVLHRYGIPWRRVQPSAVKKAFCGAGGPGKEGVLSECRRRGWDVVDDNHGDALAVLEFGQKLMAKEAKGRAAA